MVDHATTAGGRPKPNRSIRWLAGTLGLAAAMLLARTGTSMAFPLLDIENNDGVPLGTELSGADAQSLRHQLQIVNGLSAPAGGGWTFLPRIDWQEELTDNSRQVHSPRTADLISFFSPGIGIAGELPRVKLTFDYAPTLSVYARTSSLNSLTQTMNGLASVTIVPDLAYVDIRAVSGVHSLNGGIGGIGGIGGSGGAGAATASSSSIPNLSGNGQGLNKDNEVQTTSFGISPYLVRRFGDWGTGRIGYSMDVTQSDSVSGFASSPIPTGGGTNAQTLITNEQSAHFVSGEAVQYVQDTFDLNLTQSQTTSGAGITSSQFGTPAQTTQHSGSTRAILTDQLAYELTRYLSVFVSGGHESIHYTGANAQSIDGLTWSFGSTWTPNPDSQLTLSYGHQNGANSLAANGHYALTARTILTVSYGSTLGTQLEQVQNQLNLATQGNGGGLVNGQTGGQLFGTTNALGVQDGIFRTTTLTVGAQTGLDRDTFSVNLLMAKQASTSATNASSSTSKSISGTWIHQMRPDMTLSGSFSYALQDQTSGVSIRGNPGNSTTITAGLGWQWQISDTLSASLRYSFLERQSPVSFNQISQDMLILGVSKTF
jgi:uncharacterized protein (PEP-CTERM system associated)